MTDSNVPRHPVFVVGMPRSGTTLLSSLLDAHPCLMIAPETHYFTRCWTGEPVKTTADALRLLDRLLQQPGVHDMELSAEEKQRIRRAVRETTEPALGDVLRILVATYAERSDTQAWGEKTPDHLRFVPEMARQFPTAVFVAITRDPRDVCLSLRSMPWSRSTLPEQAWTWRRYAALVDRFRTDYEDRFFALRYEDLITDPEARLRDVCAFLEMPFDEAMLRSRGSENQPFDPDREPWKRKSTRHIDASNQEKWRTQMSDAERVIVERIVGRWLSAYRYPRPPVNWHPGLLGQILHRLGTAAAHWVHRTLRALRSGQAFSDDARPTWMEE